MNKFSNTNLPKINQPVMLMTQSGRILYPGTIQEVFMGDGPERITTVRVEVMDCDKARSINLELRYVVPAVIH